MGENHLECRIEGEFHQVGFSEIAASINAMAASLKENIDRAYYYELKQKEAELQELQAKFNPHFLYNSLELFCARCYQNGDEDTAELIAQTSAIFRGFIGSATFIPIREELAFSKRYLKLFSARYGDAVHIQYDFDSEVLEYGIVRNVFQPLVENYFVHGIDPSREDNHLCFHGYIQDEDLICITVEDNGLGMQKEKLEELNQRLQEPIQTETESYGLKNLHQRLRLFYGPPCGLELLPNEEGGIVIRILIRRMTCAEKDSHSQS
ncbi:MAG: sensor histidine kinase [Blautia sp.]